MSSIYVKTGTLINKKFRELFLPTVLAAMAEQLGVIANGIIVGNLIGTNALTAVSACLPLIQIVAGFGILISTGSTGLIAIASGEGNHKKANYIFSSVLTLGMIFSAVFLLLMASYTREIASLLSSVEELQPLISEYLTMLVIGAPLLLISLTWEMMLRTDGQAKIISRGIFLGQVLNVVLTCLFVGSFAMGVRGAGLALVVSTLSGGAYMIFNYLRSPERSLKFVNVLSNGLGEFFTQAAEIAKSGIPAACTIGLVSLKIWAIYQILGETGGAEAMTLFAICMACLSVTSMCISGCNGAMMPVVGMLFGEKDFSGMRLLIKYVLKFSLAISGAFVLFVMICPQIILQVYNVDANLYGAGETALRLFSISLIGQTITTLAIYYYSTVQQRTIANILALTEGILVVVPAAWFLSKVFGLNGVWLAFILAEVVGFLVVWLYSRQSCAKSEGKLEDVYLIEHSGAELLYDLSLKAKTDNAIKIAEGIQKSLEEKGFDRTIALRTSIALEEMTLNIAKINAKEIDVDIRIKNDDGIIISLRDNGIAFNPVEYSARDEDFLTDGITVLKNISHKINYNRVLSLNQTIIEI